MDRDCRITESPTGDLECWFTFHDNAGKPYTRKAESYDQGFAEAWRAVVLDTSRSLEHRTQALDVLIESAHLSHEYDCADC